MGFEDGIVGIGVELVGKINVVIHVLKADGGESGDQFAQSFHTVGFHIIQDGRGDVAVDHTSELNSSFGDDGVLDKVLLVFKGERRIIAINGFPDGVAVGVISEAHTFKVKAVDVAIIGNIFIGEEIFKAFAFGVASDAAQHLNPAVDSVGVVLEEGTRLSGLGEAVKVGDVVLANSGDVAVVGLGSEHGGDFGGVFFILGFQHSARDGAVVFAKQASAVVFGVISRSVGVGNAIGNVVAAVDGVTDGDVAADELFHITGLVRVNTRNGVAVVIHDVKVADTGVVFAFLGGELVVFVGGNFAVGFLVDTDELIPLTVLLAGLNAVVSIFNGFAVFVGLKAIIINAGAVKNHSARGGFVNAELGHNDVGFTAAASFNFGALGDDLTEDGGFADVVSETTRGAKDEAVELVGLLVAVGAGREVFIEQEVLVGLGVVNGAELFLHHVQIGFGTSMGQALGGLVVEVVAVFGEGVLVGGVGGTEPSAVEAGLFSGASVAVGASAISVVTIGVATAARRGASEGTGAGATLDDFAGVLGVKIAEALTVGEIIAEFGTRHGVFGEVILAALLGAGSSPAGETTANGAEEAVKTGADGAKDGARHLEQGDSEEEREDLESETDDDAEHAGGGEDERPANETGGTEEEAEHRVKDEHTGKEIFPLVKPFFGVGQEVGDKGERGGHNEDGDETLAETNGDETDGDRDEGAEQGENEHPKNGAETAGGGDANAGDTDAADDATGDFNPGDLAGVNAGAGENVVLDGLKEAD